MQLSRLGFLASVGVMIASTLMSTRAKAASPPTELKEKCKNPKATQSLIQGFEFQKDGNTQEAAGAYQRCLKLEPQCVACLYEIGWSYWKQGDWKEVIQTWDRVLKLDPKHAEANQYLPSAKSTLDSLEKKNFDQSLHTGVDLLIESTPKDGPLVMTFSSRWQSYQKKTTVPLDHYDPDIDSPKSIAFSTDGKLVFLNSLEAGKTIVYDALGLNKRAVINHRFDRRDARLFKKTNPFTYRFPKATKKPNIFTGKPVESALSHEGRYLWVTYYRRSYDPYGNYPSAMAVIDTLDFKIKRVFATGPISKYVQVSPNGKWLAVSHWGDNTVGLFDISGKSPAEFKESALLVVEKALPTGSLKGNRDHNCGFCVRGLAFTRDSRYLFVSRMRKGGIALFDLNRAKKPSYLGTVFGINPGPRDLHVSQSGEWLFSSCNASGFISKVPINLIHDQLTDPGTPSDRRVTINPKDHGVKSVYAGLGVRSFKLSPDDRYLFASVNQTSEVLAIRTKDMQIIARIPVDSYPVGLDISPDGSQVWVTSQGRDARGGNSVGVFQVRYKSDETIQSTSDPRRQASPLPAEN